MLKKIRRLRKEYLFRSLSEENLLPDPMRQFSAWFREAIQMQIDEPNAMVLSTSDIEGRVSGRVVLLKSFTRQGFTFFTNYTSHKGHQLEANPRAALTFFWYKMERQIRVEGAVRKVGRNMSESYFKTRPFDSQISAIISQQSRVIEGRRELENDREQLIQKLAGELPECPPDWGGYLLKPMMIEFWQGREHRLHDRFQYVRSGQDWIVNRLAP